MKNLFIRLVALLGAAMAVHGVSAQEPQKHEAELRFDQAQREELADEPSPAVTAGFAAAGRPFAYKLNRKRTSEAVAYDAVTLWNVRKVKIRDRRMKLSDSTRREKVRLLKFFIERDRKKGAVRTCWAMSRDIPGQTLSMTKPREHGARCRSTLRPIPCGTSTIQYAAAAAMCPCSRCPRSCGADCPLKPSMCSTAYVSRAASSSLSTGCSCARSKSIPTAGQWHGTIPTRGLSSGMYTPTGYPWWSSAAGLDDRGVAENLPYRRFFGGCRSAHALFLHAARRGRANLRAGG